MPDSKKILKKGKLLKSKRKLSAVKASDKGWADSAVADFNAYLKSKKDSKSGGQEATIPLSKKKSQSIKFFNKNLFNEENRILPEDSEDTIDTKMMAENLNLNVILESPLNFNFPNSAEWFSKKHKEIREKYGVSEPAGRYLIAALEPKWLADPSVPDSEKNLYKRAKEIFNKRKKYF